MNAFELRTLLQELRLTQRGAAKLLGINERTMRRYAAGEPIPRVVQLALYSLKGNKS
jgi:transcriptional regulator with XRE-family HTH domain